MPVTGKGCLSGTSFLHVKQIKEIKVDSMRVRTTCSSSKRLIYGLILGADSVAELTEAHYG